MEVSETRYAQSGDVSIAYRVAGEGPFDLVYVPPAVSNVELAFEDEDRSAFFASFDGPARAIRCASAIRDALRGIDVDIRAGLHAGESEVLEAFEDRGAAELKRVPGEWRLYAVAGA